MHIRLEGTQEEIEMAIEKLKDAVTINRKSKLYPNRRTNNPAHMRCYLDVTLTAPVTSDQQDPKPYDAVLGGKDE